ncbi:MAG: tryptophan 7-halogenase, partial [Chloroherpetonaceae bacterium]|nr:tryptophan 7-halogenase [Chthonomonadaceae bacterium]MDW8207103.1 tryptophan 7-halogenase [Chloroherpetonaceae bacterium]
GSGFGGALLAMVAHRVGRSVVLLERGQHPRFAIGESTSPLMNLLLEELGEEYALPRLLPLTTFGAWQRAYPQIACGLKRGFTYYHHREGEAFSGCPDRSDQLMVAASPGDEVADTHWFRADVDAFLVREAITQGVEYLDRTVVHTLERSGDSVILRGEREGLPARVTARFVVDATGPRGLLSRLLGLQEAGFPGYPHTQALYTHFLHVRRCDTMDDFRTAEEPPYPPDDAALHHLFPGGWMWVLRFNNGVTSAGIAVQDTLARELQLPEGEPAWRRFLERFPSIREQFADAQPVQPFHYLPRMAYRCARAAGDCWALLPSAAAFVDPLFSTGMPLTLLGLQRLGRIFAEDWETGRMSVRLEAYERATLDEADHVARFIAGCYAAFPRFPVFVALSMFYFAAASFSETARRVGRAEMATRFLLGNDPEFTAQLCRHVDRVACGLQPSDLDAFFQSVRRAIMPRNVAGLAEPDKRNWYGVDLQDLVRNADKLGMTPHAMQRILQSAPWACPMKATGAR